LKIALLIEYDGTDFAGWQVQPGVRTVQQELESACEKVFQQRVALTASGRTDSGVHGLGMVAHATLPENSTIGLKKLIEALNAESGFDVIVRDIREVPDDFNARYKTRDREYRYTIYRRRTALYRNYSWYLHGKLDFLAMQRCAAMLIGDHDFTSFSKQTDDVEHYRCIVNESKLEHNGDNIVFHIRANRFVRGMVRALVGALVEVGKGKMSEEGFQKLLENPTPEDRALHIAPAQGLMLWKIRYPKEYGLWE
jgi:tRNA pseudouridine38-40 synthase